MCLLIPSLADVHLSRRIGHAEAAWHGGEPRDLRGCG
jgi:hypothetical protein